VDSENAENQGNTSLKPVYYACATGNSMQITVSTGNVVLHAVSMLICCYSLRQSLDFKGFNFLTASDWIPASAGMAKKTNLSTCRRTPHFPCFLSLAAEQGCFLCENEVKIRLTKNNHCVATGRHDKTNCIVSGLRHWFYKLLTNNHHGIF
jgi:hypothetical protein